MFFSFYTVNFEMSVNLRPYLNETKKCRQLIAKIVKPKKSTRIKDKNISVVYAS